MQVLILLGIGFLVFFRVYEAFKPSGNHEFTDAGCNEFIGEQQIQADCGEIIKTSAGLLAVLADGIGREKRGMISSHIATDSVVGLFEEYQVMPNPVYFFKRSYHLANREILKALDGREGGVSMACVLIDRDTLYYAVAGNIQVAIFRKDSLIPLSEGHTIGKLVEQAYKRGRLSRQRALSAVKEDRLYNYVGQDGFRELELFDTPVSLKPNDRVVLMTKGIYEALPWQEIEDVLCNEKMSASWQTDEIIRRFASLRGVERDNGSVIVLAGISDR